MSIEGGPKPPAENFIGDIPFSITTESIQAHFRELEEELTQINEELAKKDGHEQLRKFAEDRKANIEEVLAVSPNEIFRSIQAVYNIIQEAEQSGLAKTDILRNIKTERPELAETIVKFYGILRSQTWGYRLGQELFASSF